MLVIRLQRTGRRNHAMFRVVVQDSRRSPTSGKVVAWLGNYDPHAKKLTVDQDKASFYLEHGAQPSPRLVILLKNEGVKLPKWITQTTKKTGTVRHPEKRRSTRPPEAEVPSTRAPDQTVEEPAPVEEAKTEVTPTEAAKPEAEPVAPDQTTEPEKN